jgi:hypothetical protein
VSPRAEREPRRRGWLLLTLVPPTARSAYERPTALNDAARVYSLGLGEVRCAAGAEWEAEANNLYPYALAWHQRYVQLLPWDRDPRCVLPWWWVAPVP